MPVEGGKGANKEEPAVASEPSVPEQEVPTAASLAQDAAMVHAEIVQRVEVSSVDQNNVVPVFLRAAAEGQTLTRARDENGSSIQPSRSLSDREIVQERNVTAGSTFQAQPGVSLVRPSPLPPRAPVTEIHRLSVSPKVAPAQAEGRGVTTALLQRQSVSPYNAIVPSHRTGTVAVTSDRTHLRRAPATASEEADVYEASLPIPSASAARAADSASTLDVSQLADRVYHLLVNRLASERSRRGM